MERGSEGESRVYQTLARLSAAYECFEHPPVATVEEAEVHWAGIEATHCKNLFLRNKKGDRHYLVVLGHRKSADLRALAAKVGDDRLSFASPERLMAHLGLLPGSVSPFGLLNDPDHKVRVIIDADLKAASHVAFHPNVNTVTVRLAREDFERYLADIGHAVQWLRM